MAELADFFWNQKKNLPVHKWHHYFDIYERHFSKFKGKSPVILEIGVFKGGSIEMWNSYFNGNCTIYGLDIDTNCKKIEDMFSNVKIYIGDQNDEAFLNRVKTDIPHIDILIDDGSHINSHIIKTFEHLYPNITMGGVYLIEDLHTSYWSEYGGGVRQPATAIEYLKTLIDKLNAKHIRPSTIKQIIRGMEKKEYIDTSFSDITNSLHFYDSIAVIEKHSTMQTYVKESVRT